MTLPVDPVGAPAEPAEVVLDCRGLRCPMPVIELARRMLTVEIGTTIRVLATDPAAASDIPAWCRMRGQQLVGVAGMPAHATYHVRRIH